MKTIIVLSLILFFNLHAFCQRISYLYNEKGQLRLDTTLSIPKPLYDTWINSENNLVAYISTIPFPPVALENNIKPKGAFILSFECDSADIINIEVLNDTSWFGRAASSGLEKLDGKKIASFLMKRSKWTAEKKYMGKYYVAISFVVIDFYEQLKSQEAVPIIRGSIPLIETLAH